MKLKFKCKLKRNLNATTMNFNYITINNFQAITIFGKYFARVG